MLPTMSELLDLAGGMSDKDVEKWLQRRNLKQARAGVGCNEDGEKPLVSSFNGWQPGRPSEGRQMFA